jgi:CRP-like cAMP-binding protein
MHRPPADDRVGVGRLTMFEGIGDGEVASVTRRLRMRRYAAGELIGGPADQVRLVKEGRVRLCTLSRSGQEVTTAVLVPGQLFGLGALLGNDAAPVLAVCLDDCGVCEASAHEFLGVLARHPLMMARVVMAMASQICRLEETVGSLVLESTRVRLARHLLRLAEAGEADRDGRLLPAETRQEMAGSIMTSRETVSRALAAWTRQGVIATRGRRVLLCDADSLAREVPGGTEAVSGPR